MSKLFIPVIHATGRPGNRSEHVARYVHEVAATYGFETELVQVADYATLITTNEGELDDQWAELAGRADGFVIVTPEYNHSFPGELKIVMDKAYDEYNHKPVGMVAVASGGLGGTRVLESLLPVFNTFKLISLRDGVYFTHVKEKFEDDGTPTTETREEYAGRLETLFTELQAYAEGLKPVREQLSK